MKSIYVLLSCLLLSGCYPSKMGPHNLRYDSIEYNHAVHNSVDTQLLLNIVRLRYRDTPSFLQVGVISSSYENKCCLGSDFKFDSINKIANISIAPKVSFDRNEKPTATYQHLRGDKFVTEMLSPISIQTMMLLQNSGWRIDRIFRCCVQRMNNIHNAPTASGPTPDFVPEFKEFREVASLLHELEIQSAVDLAKERDPKTGKDSFYMIFDKERANHSTLSRIWQLLKIEPGTEHIKIVSYRGKQHAKDELIVDTRSPISLLYFLGQGIHVPVCDEERGKVTVTTDSEGYQFDWNEVLDGIMTIHSGPVPGNEPAAAVYYRGIPFYINDSDLDSKSTFSLLSQLFALQTKAPDLPSHTPVFTIPLTD